MEAIVLQVSQQIKSISTTHAKYKILKRFCMVVLKRLGYTLIFIAIIFQCTRQCVAKWCARFDSKNIAGLEDLKRSGRPKRLSASYNLGFERSILDLMDKDKSLLCQSADFLFKVIFPSINANISRATIYRFFSSQSFRKLSPRPIHEKNDKKIMDKWLQEINPTINKIKELNKGKDVEVYFQDESRYGQRTEKYKLWAKKGSSPTYIKQNGFLNSWIYANIYK